MQLDTLPGLLFTRSISGCEVKIADKNVCPSILLRDVDTYLILVLIAVYRI